MGYQGWNDESLTCVDLEEDCSVELNGEGCDEIANYQCDECNKYICESHRVAVGIHDYCGVCASKVAEAERYPVRRADAAMIREVVCQGAR